MKKPKVIKDRECEQYIDYLEKQLYFFKSDQVITDSYLALKKFISENNKVISKAVLTHEEMSDKDEKFVDRAMKYTDKLNDYVKSLIELEDRIKTLSLPKGVSNQQAGSIYEQIM